MATNIGPKIGIDGEADYRKRINNIIQQAKLLDSEMKLVTASFDKNASSQEKNQSVMKILNQQLEVQQKRIAEVDAMLQKSIDVKGKDSTETLKWQQALVNAKTEAAKIENQIAELTNQLDENKNGFEQASEGASTFGEVLKANLLSEMIVNGRKKIAETVKDLAGEAISAAANIKAQASQFTQTFGGAGDGLTEFGDEASAAISRVADEAQILESRLTGTATKIYAFAKSSGGTSEEAMSIMEDALRAAADSAAYYDKSLEETTETLQSFLKGNYANDAALGVSATETTRNAKAMELFGKKFNDLTEIQKQQTLLKMVTDAQRLSGAMGQAAREADGWENVQGNLNETWSQFLARVGTPILESIIPIIQNITMSFNEWMQAVDWESFNQSISNFVNFFVENGETIAAVVAGIGAGFVAWNVASMINGVVASVQAFALANEGLTLGMAAVKAAVSALGGPITIIISVIGAAVAAFMTLWNTNEEFRDAITGIVNDIVTGITGFINFVKTSFTNLIASARTWGADFIQGIVDGINGMISSVRNAISNVANTIRSYIHFSRPDVGPLHEYEEWMPDFMQGLAKGIRQNQHLVTDAMAGLSSSISLNINPQVDIIGSYPRSGATVTIGQVVFNGYTEERGAEFVRDLDRQLGRLY